MEAIKYALRGVSIEQFATVFEPTSDNIQLNLNIPIRTNYDERTIAVGANIQFLDQDRPFLIAEIRPLIPAIHAIIVISLRRIFDNFMRALSPI